MIFGLDFPFQQHFSGELWLILGIALINLFGLIASFYHSHKHRRLLNQLNTQLDIEIAKYSSTDAYLRFTREHLQAIINTAAIGVIFWDLEGRIITVNQYYLDLFEKPLEFFLGKLTHEVLPTETAIQITQNNDLVVSTEHCLTFEEQLVCNRRTYHFVTTRFLVSDRHTKCVGAISLDVTAKQKSEATLRSHQEMLQAIFAHIPIMISFADTQGEIQLVNQAQVKTLGWSLADYQSDYRRIPNPMFSCGHSANTWHNHKLYNRWGRLLEISAAHVQLSDGSIITIAQDITQHKANEALLEQRIQREQALLRIVQAIRLSLKLDDVFNTAAIAITQLLCIDRVDIVRYYSDKHLWKTVYSYCSDPNLPNTIGMEIPAVNNPISDRLISLQVVQLGDATVLKDSINQKLGKHFPGAWLLVPLHFQSSLWGSLTLTRHRQPNSWQEDDLAMAEAIAEQLAIAIYQAQLHQQLQNLNNDLERKVHLQTLELQQALQHEATLKKITDQVRDSLDEEQILVTVVQSLVQTLGADFCYALIDTTHSQTSICYEATANGTACYAKSLFDLQHRQTIDLHLSGEYQAYCPLEGQQRAILHFPFPGDQGITGSLYIFKPMWSSFGDLEIRLAKQVLNQCAIALRQAHLYQELQQRIVELESLNHLKDDFLNSVSHELRNPISAIKMTADMIEVLIEEAGGFTGTLAAAERYFHYLRDECDRNAQLVDNLLELTRLKAKAEPLNLVRIDLMHWLPYVAESCLEQTRNRQQNFHVYIPPEEIYLVTDLAILERILVELLQNACKYTPPGGSISLEVEAIDSHIDIRITNSAAPFSAPELLSLFDSFYRNSDRDYWKQGGTGLGLTLVKRLVEYIGGEIKVTNQTQGVCFTVSLETSRSH